MRFANFGRRRGTYRADMNSIDKGVSFEGTRGASENNRRYGTSERNGHSGAGCSGGEVIYDMGNAPEVFDIFDAAEKNTDFRRVIWTGKHFQIVLMCVPVGGEIPFEMHEENDQLLCISSGVGEAYMGRVESNLDRRKEISGGYAAVIPSGTFHKVKNTGRAPLKLFTVYAPKHYPFGTRNINP